MYGRGEFYSKTKGEVKYVCNYETCLNVKIKLIQNLPKIVVNKRLFSAVLLIFFSQFIASATIRQYIDSFENLLTEPISTNQRLNALYTLSYEYGLINPRKGIYYANKCLKLAKQVKSIKGQFYGYNGMGNAYESLANFDSALYYHSLEYQMVKNFGTKHNIAAALSNIGICYKELGNYSQALNYFLQAYKMMEGEKAYNVRIHYYLAEMYYMLSRYEESILHSKIGFNKCSGNEFEYIGYNMIVTFAKCKLKTGKTDSAIILLSEARAKLKTYTDQVSYGICLNALGEAYIEANDYRLAIECFEEEMNLHKKVDNKNGIYLAYLNLAYANSFFEKKDLTKIKWYLKQTEANLNPIKHNKEVLLKAYYKLASTYEEIGSIQIALIKYKLYSDLKDELLNKEKYNQINELQTKYATARKEKQIQMQLAELKNKSILLERNRFQIISLVVTLAFLILFGYFFYNRFKFKQKTKLELEIVRQEHLRERALKDKENEERTRIAKDIHDELGSGLSKINLVSEIMKKQEINNQTTYEQLNSISETSIKLVENMRDLIWVWNPENNQLDNLIARIREYSYNYLEEFPLKFEINSPEMIPDYKVSGDEARHLFMIVKEILQNIVKHAFANHVVLFISIDDNLTIKFVDDGKGFNSNSEYKGNGLKNLQSRCALIEANLEITSETNKGAQVTVSLEFKKLAVL
jgi:signal transduction histidine kinase